MNAKEFYVLASKRSHINAFGVTCQSAVETGRWTSELWKQAHNGAGLKIGSTWKGPVYMKDSPEQREDGSVYIKKSAFRKYASADEFLDDFDAKIASDYPLCAARKESFLAHFSGLYKGRWGSWATDKSYFKKNCIMAVAFAPDFFGSLWRNKLVDSLTYAVEKKYITDEEARIFIEVMRAACGSAAVNNVNKATVTPSAGGEITICVDAGHGGTDPGASGGGVAEKNVTRACCEMLGRTLTGAGYSVSYSRTADESVSLQERVSRANASKAACFISLHCNAAVNTSASGIEIWTSVGQTKSDTLASWIIEEILKLEPDLKVRADRSDGDVDKEKNFYVIKNTSMPAVLLEMGFISNEHDRKMLLDEGFRKNMCTGILKAVNRFTGTAK